MGLWDLKMGTGGLVDIEFTVQLALLSMVEEAILTPSVPGAIDQLESAGRFTKQEASTLSEAHVFLSSLQQIQRIALKGDIQPDHLAIGLKDRLQRAVGLPDFEAVQTRLAACKSDVEAIRIQRIGEI